MITSTRKVDSQRVLGYSPKIAPKTREYPFFFLRFREYSLVASTRRGTTLLSALKLIEFTADVFKIRRPVLKRNGQRAVCILKAV